ncbi:hypothetical protein AAMO2058_000816600 [Amorphochlora amoebiformis]
MNPAITVKQLFEIALVNAPGIQEGHEEYQPMSRTYAQTSLGATILTSPKQPGYENLPRRHGRTPRLPLDPA